jgi:cell division septation protein DedD
MPKRMRTYHMVSYPMHGARASPGRPLLWLRLGAIALVVLIVSLPVVFRHHARGPGEGPLAAAPAALPVRPNATPGGSQGPDPVAHSSPVVEPAPSPPRPSTVPSLSGHLPVVRGEAGGRYHVQVGALTDQAAAEALVRRLRALGYAVRIVGTQPYLVWVGGYLDAPTAGRLISRLQAQGFNAVLSH